MVLTAVAGPADGVAQTSAEWQVVVDDEDGDEKGQKELWDNFSNSIQFRQMNIFLSNEPVSDWFRIVRMNGASDGEKTSSVCVLMFFTISSPSSYLCAVHILEYD